MAWRSVEWEGLSIRIVGIMYNYACLFDHTFNFYLERKEKLKRIKTNKTNSLNVKVELKES